MTAISDEGAEVVPQRGPEMLQAMARCRLEHFISLIVVSRKGKLCMRGMEGGGVGENLLRNDLEQWCCDASEGQKGVC